jgi:hypothetical protein
MIPHEKALVERLKNKPFALIGINTDKDKEAYRERARKLGVTWRSSWQGSTNGVLPRTWGISGFPTIFVLDAKGAIRYRFDDAVSEELDKAVDALLAELEEKH